MNKCVECNKEKKPYKYICKECEEKLGAPIKWQVFVILMTLSFTCFLIFYEKYFIVFFLGTFFGFTLLEMIKYFINNEKC